MIYDPFKDELNEARITEWLSVRKYKGKIRGKFKKKRADIIQRKVLIVRLCG